MENSKNPLINLSLENDTNDIIRETISVWQRLGLKRIPKKIYKTLLLDLTNCIRSLNEKQKANPYTMKVNTKMENTCNTDLILTCSILACDSDLVKSYINDNITESNIVNWSYPRIDKILKSNLVKKCKNKQEIEEYRACIIDALDQKATSILKDWGMEDAVESFNHVHGEDLQK